LKSSKDLGSPAGSLRSSKPSKSPQEPGARVASQRSPTSPKSPPAARAQSEGAASQAPRPRRAARGARRQRSQKPNSSSPGACTTQCPPTCRASWLPRVSRSSGGAARPARVDRRARGFHLGGGLRPRGRSTVAAAGAPGPRLPVRRSPPTPRTCRGRRARGRA
jgi:hypothetical protein